MALTSVQLSSSLADAEVAIELPHGTPARTLSGSRGPIACFQAGALVVVALTSGRARQVDVFRTVHDHRRGSLLPYVSRPVKLLLSAPRAPAARRLRALLALTPPDALDALPDSLFFRLAPLLSARRPRPLSLPMLEDS